MAELKYDPTGLVTVRLEPTATAKGTVVDEKGRPLKNAQVLPWIVLTRDERELKEDDFGDDAVATDYLTFTSEPLLQTRAYAGKVLANQTLNPAEFKFDNLIPGVRFYVGANGTYHAIGVLKPGELRDLGNIVVRRPNEDE